MGLESSGVYQQSFTFWSVTLQPLGAYRYTIPHMKGDIHSFNMRYNSMTCTKTLQRYSFCNCLIGPSLVCTSLPKCIKSLLLNYLSNSLTLNPNPTPQLLLEEGADVDATNRSGNTATHIACLNGHDEGSCN